MKTLKVIISLFLLAYLGNPKLGYGQGVIIRPQKEQPNEKITSEKINKQEQFISSQISTPSDFIGGHGFVDLGIGIKWATCNLGASSPSEYGNFYAWGETATKNSYDEENSTTYNIKTDDISGKSTYDVARLMWGDTWRLPTKDEFEILLTQCVWTEITEKGHKGMKVTGPNGNSIFLPATGVRVGKKLNNRGSCGYYWSSTPYTDEDNYNIPHPSWDIIKNQSIMLWSHKWPSIGGVGRASGYAIRPVSD
ncbi:MAG: DUF1566 domain-containing protein [Bacteroidales bacterium]|nr:DUF1566 domain-containing protein [Bacteroidales bacterium]